MATDPSQRLVFCFDGGFASSLGASYWA